MAVPAFRSSAVLPRMTTAVNSDLACLLALGVAATLAHRGAPLSSALETALHPPAVHFAVECGIVDGAHLQLCGWNSVFATARLNKAKQEE